MDAMCWSMTPRYDTLPGRILAVDRREDELLVTVELRTGKRTSAPAMHDAWRVGAAVEVLVHRTPFGIRRTLAVRTPLAA